MKPRQVLLFIALVMACLAVMCIALPQRFPFGGYMLRWLSLAEVFDLPSSQSSEAEPNDEEPTDDEPTESSAFLAVVDTGSIDTIPEPVKRPNIPVLQVDSTTDSRIFLARFYSSLTQTGDHKVRVMHYGDSQIEEDRMTAEIRRTLQSRYGGAGVGLVPLVQTIPSRAVHQELHMNGRLVTPQQGPRRYLVHGPKHTQRKDGMYGPMGHMAVMSDSLVSGSEQLMSIIEPLDGGPRYSGMRVFADTTIRYTRSADTLWLNGKGNVYALSQETDTGVIVDNIPMRGCLGLVFTKIDSVQLARFYAQENVTLIILQFGGNAIPFNETPSTIRAIVKGLRQQVRYLQACAPDASFLFVGPSDMTTTTDGVEQTYPMVPYMDRLLRKMALEENIAYFSLYRWMGGSGSMQHWQDVGLAGTDGVHFTRAGARKAGKALVQWMIDGMPADTPPND